MIPTNGLITWNSPYNSKFGRWWRWVAARLVGANATRVRACRRQAISDLALNVHIVDASNGRSTLPTHALNGAHFISTDLAVLRNPLVRLPAA